MDNIGAINQAYWKQRASGYSEVNKEELAGVQKEKWTLFLKNQILSHFKGKAPSEIKILDVGAGPGFISIILAHAGFNVTAFDFAEDMLQEARKNVAQAAELISFVQGNAMKLSFDKDSFDVVFSRNLMWNIPFPEEAYEQWIRVLKPGGLMLVFDANWYSYLVDDAKRREYEADRKNVAAAGLEDYNIGANFDEMEAIAADLPLTKCVRPRWDGRFLESLDAGRVETVEDVGRQLYSDKELVNYKSTPMFMVKFVKN